MTPDDSSPAEFTPDDWLGGLTLLPAQPGEARRAQVARTLRSAVVRGLLPEGTRLPGHRRLAQRLGVSRNTLVDALDTLQSEGFLRATGRSGTVICAPALPAQQDDPDWPLPLSAWATRALSGQLLEDVGQYAVDFRVGQSVPELYPQTAWAQALARRAGQLPAYPSSADALGPLETRRALAAYLNAQRGARVTPDMLMLTSGTQAALDALARVFLEAGRVVVVEDPTYPFSRAALAATGAQLYPVPVDTEGLRVDALPQRATLAYVTPGCQYPTNALLSATRRQALIGWARAQQAFILEDDYAADLHHTARPPSVMQGLAPDRVILLGSFSKSLAPVTRSGFLAAPPAVIEVLAGTRPITDRAPGTLDALALADVLSSGAYARHLRRAQQLIARRHDVLLEALRHYLPGWPVQSSQAGLHAYLPLPAPLSEAQVVRRAARRGVALSPVAPLAVKAVPPAVLLGFAHLPPQLIRDGIRRLADPPQPGGWT